MLYPLRFTPQYFEKVWGGRRLASLLQRDIPPTAPIGECWEISDHPHGRSVVANGADAGLTLHDLMLREGKELLGSNVPLDANPVFPLLIKYIDAEEQLSVQVHPNDAYAASHAGELGKTEMWYVLHADPNACLIAGLRDNVTAEQFRAALIDGDPAALLHHMPVKTGESIFIPAGRIHAIMPGLLILEIQQNSDTTYRLYDWRRLGLDGKPRALHVEQAMAVTDWHDYAPSPAVQQSTVEQRATRMLLAACQYFRVEKLALTSPYVFTGDGGSFQALNVVVGSGTLAWAGGRERLRYSDSLLIPAALTTFTLEPDEEMAVVMSCVPAPRAGA